MGDIIYDEGKTITIFNRAQGDGVLEADIWYPTVLTHARVVESLGRNITSTGLMEADAIKVHLMIADLDKPYLAPVAWNNLENKALAFTLSGCRQQASSIWRCVRYGDYHLAMRLIRQLLRVLHCWQPHWRLPQGINIWVSERWDITELALELVFQ